MTDLAIYVYDIATEDGSSNVVYRCKIRSSGMTHTSGDVLFDVVVAPNALAATVNSSIKDAALQAAQDYELGTVQLTDKKTLVGGAVGL